MESKLNPRIETWTAVLGMVGSRQHVVVAARRKATGCDPDRLINAHSNAIRWKSNPQANACDWPMPQAKRMTTDNRQNSEYCPDKETVDR